MKHKQQTSFRPLLVTLVFLWVVQIHVTGQTRIDNLYYTLNPTEHTAKVEKDKSYGGYHGNIAIPETVTYQNETYTVTSVDEGAFSFSPNVTSISFPATVTEIGELTSTGYFSMWSSGKITAFYVAENNPNFCAQDGVLFNKDKTILYQYPPAKQGDYIVPSSVTRLGTNSFDYCQTYASIFIHKNAVISSYTFNGSYLYLWIENGYTGSISSQKFEGLDKGYSIIFAPTDLTDKIRSAWKNGTTYGNTTEYVPTDIKPYL